MFTGKLQSVLWSHSCYHYFEDASQVPFCLVFVGTLSLCLECIPSMTLNCLSSNSYINPVKGGLSFAFCIDDRTCIQEPMQEVAWEGFQLARRIQDVGA